MDEDVAVTINCDDVAVTVEAVIGTSTDVDSANIAASISETATIAVDVNAESVALSIEAPVVTTTTIATMGAMGPVGPTGPASPEFTHTQTLPSDEWVVNHNLGFRPDVSIVVGGVIVEAHIVHVSSNQLLAQFSSPYTGEARCT